MPKGTVQNEALLALAEAQAEAVAMIGKRGEDAQTARRRARREYREQRFAEIVRRSWRRATKPPSRRERELADEA